MSKTFLVSIIVPVYSERPYLHEALDSVINQTYQDLEIIIIDDGSIDGSGEIADEYAEKDKRITVIHQENKGLATVRNVGLDMMSGDTVVFFDSDDALMPDYVETMLNAMQKTRADLVVCKYTVDKTEGLLQCKGQINSPIESGLYNHANALQELVNSNINVHAWNKLYKRKLWKKVRFPDGHIYEDIATTFKVFNLCKKVCVLDKPLYIHRKREGSITSSRSIKKYYDLAWAYSQFASFVEKNIPDIFTTEQLNRLLERRDFYERYIKNSFN